MNVAEQVKALEARVAALEQAANKTRDRGPKSQREMTDADAFRVKHGDLKGANHKVAAETLNLSYGQVYSARGGYTFKHVKEDWKPTAPATTETPADAQA